MMDLFPIPWSRTRKFLSGAVAAVYLLTNVAGAHAAESGFWSARRDAIRQRQPPAAKETAAPLVVAALPAGFDLPSYQPRVLGAPPSSETDSAAVAGTAFRRVSEIDLPRWLADVVAPHGTVRDVYLSNRPDAPLVIHLQDLHDSVEAQRHIAGLLSDLQDARGVSLVGLEGAQGEFALGAFRSYPDAGLLRAVADHLMVEGFLGGPEFAGLTLAQPPLLWGIEDSKLYESNLAVVKESARRRPSFEAFTVKARAVLEKVKDRRLPTRLMEFDRRWSGYQSGAASLGDTVKYLLRVAPTPTLRYGNLHLLADALEWEALLDKKKIESERALILDRLARALPRSELDRLVAQSALHRLGRVTYGEFHRFFRGMCLRNGVALDGYEHFNNYIRYILLAERINRNDLFVELEALQLEVQNLLALTTEERRVMTAVRHLALVERLARHAYTPMDWRYHETHAAALHELGKEIATLAAEVGLDTDLVSPSEDLFRPFEAFCGDAVNRNTALVRGLLDKMRAEKRKAAVLVAGGFHTEGLTHLLRQQGVSYAVVTPKITGAPPASSKTLDLLARDPAPLEKLFAGETLNIPTPRLTALSNAKMPIARRLVILKAALLASLTIFATNAPLSAAAADSLQSWPVIEKVSGRARSPTEAVLTIQTEDGQRKRWVATTAPAADADPDYHGTVGDTEVYLESAPPASSLARRLRERWDSLFLITAISSRRRAPLPTASPPLDTTPFPQGRDPWGARDAGDVAIGEAMETGNPDVHVFSGDFDLSAKNNASIGKIAVGSIQESNSPDLIAARGPAPFWEIRAALAAAMKEAGADIYAGAGGDEFRGVARGKDAPRRLVEVGQRLNAHFVGRYQFFHITHPDPDNPAVQADVAERVRRWVEARTPDGPYRLVRFGNGFTLVTLRAGRGLRASSGLRRALGPSVRVRERLVERLGLGPFSVSMGVVSAGVAKSLLISVAGTALADNARALAVWIQRFANDALGEAKNRGRNRVYAPADVEELTGVLKKGSVTVEHVRGLREELRTGKKTAGSAALAADGETPVRSLSEFWSAVKDRRGEDLDLLVFTVVRYTPTHRGAVVRRVNDTLRRVPARFRRWVPGALLRRVDSFIQKRAFHAYQGSDYEKGNRAIAAFVKHVTETVTNGSAGRSPIFGRSVDTVFAAVPSGGPTNHNLPLGQMMEAFRKSLNVAEGRVMAQPRAIVYRVRGRNFKELASSTGGMLDTMAHVEELLETYSREATAYLGSDLVRGALQENLKAVFDVRAGANFIELTYDPDKAGRMMVLYRQSQMEDAERAESVLFARAPEELGSLLYRGYARLLERAGVSEHRVRLWLGSRYAQAFIIPAVELFGLPGVAWLLSPLMGWGLAVVAGSALFTLMHGLPGLTRGPPALRQGWGQFLARLFISLLINAAALSVGPVDPAQSFHPVFEIAGIPFASLVMAYASHAGWNFLVPEKYRFSLIPGNKYKVPPVAPAAATGNALRSPKQPLNPDPATGKGGETDLQGTVRVGLVELNIFLDETENSFRQRRLPFSPADREALHFAIRLAAPVYARGPRTDPYAPSTPYEAVRRAVGAVSSADGLIAAVSPIQGPLADGLFGTGKAAAFLQGKVLPRDANTFVDLIRAGAALEQDRALLWEMTDGGALTSLELRDTYLIRGPPLTDRLAGALRALRLDGNPSSDQILAEIDALYARYSLTWAERGVLYLIALTRGEGAGSVRGPPGFNAVERLHQLLRSARAGGGVADNKWSETQRSLTQAANLLSDFSAEFPEHLSSVRFGLDVSHNIARFGGNERVLVAGMIAGVGIDSPVAGEAFWKYIEKKGFGVQRVESLRWIRELAAPWAAAHLARYNPAERSLGAIRNQMGFIIQRLGTEDPDLVAQLLWAGKLAELKARTGDGTRPSDPEIRRLAQEISDVHARFAERFGQTGAGTQILDEVFRLAQPARYFRLKKDFQRVTGLSYEEARERFQKLIPEFETLLAAEGVNNAEVHGRVKGLWSISQKLANKRASLEDVKDLFGFYVAYENASGQPGAVRAALQKLNAGQFLEDNVETHIGADYSIHKFVSVLSAVDGFANARLEVQVFDSDDFLRSKEGVAARWVYGLGKEIKPSGWVQIDRFEYTGNLRDDLKHFQRRARENGFVYVNVETPDGQSVPIRMIDLPRGGLFPGDAASHWRVNALNGEYQGFEEISLGRDGRPARFPLNEGHPLSPGSILALLPPDAARPGTNEAAMEEILALSQRPRTLVMATLSKGELTLKQLADQGRRTAVAAFFNDAPFSRFPDITDFEIRQLTRLAKSMGFGGNVMELYAYLGLLTGAAREGLSREVAEYLTIDTVKARRGPAAGMTATVNGEKVDLYREGYEIVEITGRHDRPAALLDVVKILKSYRIKVNDFIYLPQTNGGSQESYVIQLAVKTRSALLDRALADIQMQIADVPRTIEDPLFLNVEVIAPRSGARPGAPEPDVEFLEALRETNIETNIAVNTLANGDVQMQTVVACPRGFLPFLESDLRNRFGSEAYVSVRKKNGLTPSTVLPVLLAPVLTGLVGLLSATPAYSAVETASPAALGFSTYLILGVVVAAAIAWVWRASPDRFRWYFSAPSPEAVRSRAPTSPGATEIPGGGAATTASPTDEEAHEKWLREFVPRAQNRVDENSKLSPQDRENARGFIDDVFHVLTIHGDQSPPKVENAEIEKAGDSFVVLLGETSYDRISRNALSLMETVLNMDHASLARTKPARDSAPGSGKSPGETGQFFLRLEESIRRLNPGSDLKTFTITHGGQSYPVVLSSDMPVSYLRVGALMAVRPEETPGEGLAMEEDLQKELRDNNLGFLVPRGVDFGPYVVPFLVAMQANASQFVNAVVEDDGAGNGILTWAALRLGARRVVAIEKDPRAVEEFNGIFSETEYAGLATLKADDFNRAKTIDPSARVVVFEGTFEEWNAISIQAKETLLGPLPTLRLADVGPFYPDANEPLLLNPLNGLNIFGGYLRTKEKVLAGLFFETDPRPYQDYLNRQERASRKGAVKPRPVSRVDHVDGNLVFSAIVLGGGETELSVETDEKDIGGTGGMLSALLAPLAGFLVLWGFTNDVQAAAFIGDGRVLDRSIFEAGLAGLTPDAQTVIAWLGEGRWGNAVLVSAVVAGLAFLAAMGYWGGRLKREFFIWLEYRWPVVREDFERKALRFFGSFQWPAFPAPPNVRRPASSPIDLSMLSPESILPGRLVEEMRALWGPGPNAAAPAPRPLWRSALRWVATGALFSLLLAGSSPVSAADIAAMLDLPIVPGDSWGGTLLAATLGGTAASAVVLPRVFELIDDLRGPFENDAAFGDRLNRFLFSIRRNPAALEAFSGSLRYLMNDTPGPRQMALFRILQRVEVLRALELAQTHTARVRRAMQSGNRRAVTAAMATAGLELGRLRAEWRGFPDNAQDVLVPVEHMAGYFFEEIASDLVGESVARSKRFEGLRAVAERALAKTERMIVDIRLAVVNVPAADFLPVMADTETIDMYELAERGALAYLVRHETVRSRWQLTREMRADVKAVAERLLEPIHSDEKKRREIWGTLSDRVDLYADTPRLLMALRTEAFRLMSGGQMDGEAFEQNRALAKLLLRRIDAKNPRSVGGKGIIGGLWVALAFGVVAGLGGVNLETITTAAATGWNTLGNDLGAGVVLVGTLSAGFAGGVVKGKAVPYHDPETDLQLYWLKLTSRLPLDKDVIEQLNQVAVSLLVEIEMEGRRWPLALWFYSNRLREHGVFKEVNRVLKADGQSPDVWLKNVGREFRDRLVIANARELGVFASRLKVYVDERMAEAAAAAQRFRDQVPPKRMQEAARKARAAEAERSRTMEEFITQTLPDDLAEIARAEFHRVVGLSSAVSSDEYTRVMPGTLEVFDASLKSLAGEITRRLMEIEHALAIRPSGVPLDRLAGSDALDVTALLERSRRDQKAMGWLMDQARGFYGRFPMGELLGRALRAWTPASPADGKSRFMLNAAQGRNIVAWMLASPQGPGPVTRGARPYGLPHWTRWMLNAVLQAAGYAVAPVDRKLQGRVNRVVRRLADPRLQVRDVTVVSGAAFSSNENRFVLTVRDHSSGRVQVRIHQDTLNRWVASESVSPGYFETLLEAALRHALARAEGVPAGVLEEFGLSAEGVEGMQDAAIFKDSVGGAVARAHGLAAAARLGTKTELGLPTVGPARGPVAEALKILAPEGRVQPLSRVITLETLRDDVDEAGRSRREKLALWVNGLSGETAKTEGRSNTGPEWEAVFEASTDAPWIERRDSFETNLLKLIEREGGDDPRRSLRARLTRDVLKILTEANSGVPAGRNAAETLDRVFGLVGRLHALGGALTLADDGRSKKKAEWADLLLPAFQDLDIRLLGEMGVSWLGRRNLAAALNRSARFYSHAILQGVRLRDSKIAFDEAILRDGDVLVHVSPGMVDPERDMTASETTQLEQIARLNSGLNVLGDELKPRGRFVFLTETGVNGSLPEVIEALGRKAQRAGLATDFDSLAIHARTRGQKVFARSLEGFTTHSETQTRVDAERLFNTIPELSNPFLFRLDQPGVSWHLGSWADRLAAELVAVMGGLVRDQARRVSEELRKEGVLRYQA
ncbi:MAG: hypothetical protein IPH91_08660 [Elusimicrobia bacterium]|nr:hypothetical protein [Elusimicrobiota bacterium]